MSMQFVDRTPPEGGGVQAMLAVGGDSVRLTPILIPDDSAMVFSVWCQAEDAATITIIGGNTQAEIEVGTGWSRAVVAMEDTRDVVLTVPTGKSVYFYKAQLETGTKVTDWKPAPEDTDEKIDNIQIGGANLYTGTQNFDGTDWQSWSIGDWTRSDDTFDGLAIMQRTGAWSGLTQPIEATTGDEYTLSAYVLPSSDADVRFYCENADKNGTIMVQDYDLDVWVRIAITFTVTADAEITPRFENTVDSATLAICGLKLERGNRATDWTPAPSDLQKQIDEAASTANRLKNVIKIDNAGAHFRAATIVDGEAVVDENANSLNLSYGGMRINSPTYTRPDGSPTVGDDRDRWIATADKQVIGDLVIYNAGGCVNFRVRKPGEVFS